MAIYALRIHTILIYFIQEESQLYIMIVRSSSVLPHSCKKVPWAKPRPVFPPPFATLLTLWSHRGLIVGPGKTSGYEKGLGEVNELSSSKASPTEPTVDALRTKMPQSYTTNQSALHIKILKYLYSQCHTSEGLNGQVYAS